eukprot:scaffold34639_cov206-Amphora_coffeaeformis.AAC.11
MLITIKSTAMAGVMSTPGMAVDGKLVACRMWSSTKSGSQHDPQRRSRRRRLLCPCWQPPCWPDSFRL